MYIPRISIRVTEEDLTRSCIAIDGIGEFHTTHFDGSTSEGDGGLIRNCFEYMIQRGIEEISISPPVDASADYSMHRPLVGYRDLYGWHQMSHPLPSSLTKALNLILRVTPSLLDHAKVFLRVLMGPQKQ